MFDKLSESLPVKQVDQCGQCGLAAHGGGKLKQNLTYWQECDDDDQPTRTFIVLCQACADKLIERHPRLYRETTAVTPMPGVMSVCADCVHRIGLACACPLAKFNGGPGLKYQPEGSMIHVCRSPRRLSGWIYSAPAPVTHCSGKALR